MAEWGAPVYWPAFLYASAAAGAAAGLALRGLARRDGRPPASGEATWNVLLAPATALVLPVLAASLPHGFLEWSPVHALWHQWELALHASPALHTMLHLLNGLLLLGFALSLAKGVLLLSRIRAFGAEVRSHAHPAGDGFDRLRSPRPLCFTLGWVRPRTYVSTALEEALPPETLAAALAHEAAHARRRDPLRLALLTFFYTVLPVPGGSLLIRDWEHAAERLCDAEAARQVGPLQVAAALVRTARLTLTARPELPAATPFVAAGEDLEERVQALIAPGAPLTDAPAWLRGSAVVLLLSSGAWLSHLAEFFSHH